jgi:hypothetical protein
MPNDPQTQINAVRAELEALKTEFYRGNFSDSQDNNKYARFNTRMKVPTLSATPATCEVGEVCCVSGKLRVCSAANTWTIVGVQS